MIIIAGEVKLKDAAEMERVRGAITAMVEASRAEEGCISYAFGRDLTDPSVFVVLERWKDQAALDEHFQTPHMATFLKEIADFAIIKGDVHRYEASDLGPVGS